LYAFYYFYIVVSVSKKKKKIQIMERKYEGLFFNSSPALDLKIPLETPLNNSQYILSTYNSQHNNNNNNVVLAMTMPYSGQGIGLVQG
jgi:hypothetical protein